MPHWGARAPCASIAVETTPQALRGHWATLARGSVLGARSKSLRQMREKNDLSRLWPRRSPSSTVVGACGSGFAMERSEVCPRSRQLQAGLEQVRRGPRPPKAPPMAATVGGFC